MGDVGTQKSLPQTQVQAETPRSGSFGRPEPLGRIRVTLDQVSTNNKPTPPPEESITLQIVLRLFWKDEIANISEKALFCLCLFATLALRT